ncbi:MAG: NPCBM/NEW2 domain-containing protein [Kiritimatiellae bacterium]|nr:NPCBM/NEW2 domain-containing protein [Kiritimatiellia bacterium]
MRMLRLAALCLTLFVRQARAEKTVWLDEFDITHMTCAEERPQTNRTVNGNSFKIARKRFTRGVGTHAESWYALDIQGQALAFQATVGLDDEELTRGKGSVIFRVYADNRLAADSGVMRSRQPPATIKADLSGARRVILHVSDAGDGDDHDHADWCDAFFTLKAGTALNPVTGPLCEQLGILTPPAPPSPRINGPRILGSRPGNPVLFAIPATGEPPLIYDADNLPKGLTVDRASGVISGSVSQPGAYDVDLSASNSHGEARRTLRLEIGQRLSLTPPMGWNSWNCYADKVTDAKIRRAALSMVESGLSRHGWSYVNIDDYWQTSPGEKHDETLMGPARGSDGRILPNRRFPNMLALCDYVHGLGLKIGIYSSPGPLTCGGCVGSWEHEQIDAQTYADWGFDYLKYDWCSYVRVAGGDRLKHMTRPYLSMSTALRAQKRDIVFSLCQYGMAHVSAWGRQVGGHCWRTTPDIVDTWESMSKIADAQDGLELFAGPGGWNDPDMLVVGTVGWGNPHPTRLTPNEQYTHISLWCLLSAPLLIGCDMSKLDDFTLNLLTNDEVLAVNQDPLGRQAARIMRNDAVELWAKPMSDGSVAAGIFNRSMLKADLAIDFKTLGLTGPQHVRDLWRQKDLGVHENIFKTVILGRAVCLIRLAP